ncbi:MAG: hypothetical protein HS113_17650 [Verrucomicrobiales bacterium]|nr:hypothetical protein [Verrucomicrobiales bacterium]
MKLPTLGTLVLIVAALGGGFVAVRQHRQIEQLKVETTQLAEPSVPHDRPGTHPPVPSPPAPSELSETEKLELIRLRGEVTRLRQQVRDLDGVRAEHQRLRTSLGLPPAPTNAAPPGASGATGTGAVLPPPARYLRRQDAQFAGFATPEAALQSVLWAIEHRDANALLSSTTEDVRGRLLEVLASDHAERMWEGLRLVQGLRLLSTEPAGDELVIQAEFLPGEPAESIRLVRQGNEWKIRTL